MMNNSLISINDQKYQLLEECLGVGSFGEVYKAVNVITGEEVAVKCATCDDTDIAINQVKMLGSLNESTGFGEQWNRNNSFVPILRLLGTYRSYNQFYIVTQYYGHSLEKQIKKQNTIPFNFKFALTIFKSILKAVQPLRNCKILHRDIKPSNILIKVNNSNEEYQCKMCDFGLAMKESLAKTTLFQTDRVGTIEYQSPQVIKFREYSQKSQVWSLGVILYELIYCKLPYEKVIYNKIESLYQESISKPIKFNSIPGQIAKLGQKCLSNSLHRRFTFLEIIQNLNLILINQEKELNIQGDKYNKFSNTEILSFSASALTASSYSGVSGKDKETNGPNGRKISCDTISVDESEKTHFLDMLVQCYKELYQRVNNMKKSKKKSQIKLLNICETFVNKYENNEQYLNFFTSQVVTILSQNLSKLKLVCEYSEDQKNISFNLKQFMLADTLILIYEATQNKIQNNLQNAAWLEYHLKSPGQAKSMQYYKQLRQKIINFV